MMKYEKVNECRGLGPSEMFSHCDPNVKAKPVSILHFVLVDDHV
jgi:hypothetical protein